MLCFEYILFHILFVNLSSELNKRSNGNTKNGCTFLDYISFAIYKAQFLNQSYTIKCFEHFSLFKVHIACLMQAQLNN